MLVRVVIMAARMASTSATMVEVSASGRTASDKPTSTDSTTRSGAGVGSRVSLGVPADVRVTDTVALDVWVAEGASVGVSVPVTELDAITDGSAVDVADSDCVVVPAAVPVPAGVLAVVLDTNGVSVGAAVGKLVIGPDSDTVAVGDTDDVTVDVLVIVLDTDAVGVGDSDGEPVGVLVAALDTDAVGVGDSDGVLVNVLVADTEGVVDSVGVAVLVNVLVGVTDGVVDSDSVAVLVNVLVALTEGVADSDGVAVSVTDPDGVHEYELVAVPVGMGDSDGVTVTVLVEVAVTGVGDGVEEGGMYASFMVSAPIEESASEFVICANVP